MYFIVSLVLIVFMLIVPEHAEARKWRVKPSDLAADYSQIIDQRPGNDVVVIDWVAPETMDANIKNVDAYRAMLRDSAPACMPSRVISKNGRPFVLRRCAAIATSPCGDYLIVAPTLGYTDK